MKKAIIALVAITLAVTAHTSALFRIRKNIVSADWQQLRDVASVLTYNNAKVEQRLPMPNRLPLAILFTRADIRNQHDFTLFGDVMGHHSQNLHNKPFDKKRYVVDTDKNRHAPKPSNSTLSENSRHVATDKIGHLILTVRGSSISGNLFDGQHNYQLQPLKNGRFKITLVTETSEWKKPKQKKRVKPVQRPEWDRQDRTDKTN